MAITAREVVITLGFRTDNASMQNAENGLNKIMKVAKVLGGVFVTGIAARGFKNLVNLASDAAERENKFAAIFQNAANTTTTALEEIAGRTGAASGQLQDYAAQLGAVLKPQLGSADAAGEMSARLAEVALDIASFQNLRPEEALMKLRSGLLGSVEPMDQVGVNLRKNNLDLDNFAASLGKTTKELTQGELMQARYNAILRQLDQQGSLGDADRTSEDLANASRNLRGNLRQLGEEIGKAFLPSVKASTVSMLAMVKGMLEWWKANGAIIRQNIGRHLKVLSTIISGLLSPLGLLASAVLGLGIAMQVMGANAFLAWLIGFAPVVAMVALIGLISAAIWIIIDDLNAMGEGGESVIGTLIQGFMDLVNELGSIPAAIGDMLKTALSFWFEYFARIAGVSEETIGHLKDWFQGLFDFVINGLKNLVAPWKFLFDAASNLFGGDEAGASPGAAAAGATQQAQVTTNATINVQPGPGQSAEDVGRGAMMQAQDLRAKDERRAAKFAFEAGGA